MPLYDFKCEKCGKIAEILCEVDEKQFCVECNNHEMVKQMPTWGWYSIDGDNSASQTPHKFRKNNATYKRKD